MDTLLAVANSHHQAVALQQWAEEGKRRFLAYAYGGDGAPDVFSAADPDGAGTASTEWAYILGTLNAFAVKRVQPEEKEEIIWQEEKKKEEREKVARALFRHIEN